MSVVDRAAEVCEPWAFIHEHRGWRVRTAHEIAQALADAGHLVTDEVQAVLAAAEALHATKAATASTEFIALLWALDNACADLLASRPS